jgi:integrase
MRRQGNKLSAAFIRNVKKPGLYADGHNLYLQVSEWGTKAWIFRFDLDGRHRKMGLAPLHTVSLQEARRRAAELRLKVHDGIDPIEDRAAARAARKAEAAKALTFGECARRYIEANRSTWSNAKHAAQWASTFSGKQAATAAINDLPVAAIDTGLILRVLEPLWTSTPETASRVRGRIERVLGWASVRGFRAGDNPARWDGHLKETLPSRAALARGRHDAVPYAQLPAFMQELRSLPDLAARALELAILAAARTGEILGLRWPEIDVGAALWVVPAERMKSGKSHRVALSAQALKVLAALPREGDLVFPGARPGRPMSHMAMLDVVRRMRGPGPTVHGFRSSFKDWASEQTGYPNELSEVALAHATSDKTEAAYRRGDQMEKRRRLMSDWADFCDGPTAERGENVTGIREAVA